MKKGSILFAIFIFSAAVAFGQTKYKTYPNERFGYSILYPYELFQTQKFSFNGDGGRFISKDESAEMSVWAHYNAMEHTLKEEFEEDLKSYGDKVSYKLLLKNGFVISGTKDDKIFYQKTLYHKFKDTEVFYIFTIEYKTKARKKFDPIVRKIAQSFNFNPNADV